MRSHRRWFSVWLLSALGLFSLESRPAWAKEDVVPQRIKRILDAGWGKSADSIGPAEEEYQAAKAKAPSDPRLPYALALVHMKHRKYKEAAKLLDESVELDAAHIPARIAKIWIEMLLKRHDAALTQMEELGELLKADDDGVMSIDLLSQQIDAARFLGRVLAFLEGPAQTAANTDQVVLCKETIWSTLSEDLQQEFTAGHEMVCDCCTELVAGQVKTKEETKAEQEKKQESDEVRLAAEREVIKAKTAQVEQQATEARETFDRSLREIEGKLAPLEAEYARLDGIATSLRSQIGSVEVQISSISATCHSQCKGSTTCSHRVDIARLSGIQAGLVADLRGVQASGNQIAAQGNVLYQQRDRLIDRYNEEARKLGREQVSLGKKDKKFSRDQEKNRKAPTGNSVKVHNLTEKARSLTTCNPFPLEKAKTCVLEKKSEELDPYRAVLMSIGRLPEDSHYHLDSDGRVTTHDSVLIQQASRRRMW